MTTGGDVNTETFVFHFKQTYFMLSWTNLEHFILAVQNMTKKRFMRRLQNQVSSINHTWYNCKRNIIYSEHSFKECFQLLEYFSRLWRAHQKRYNKGELVCDDSENPEIVEHIYTAERWKLLIKLEIKTVKWNEAGYVTEC